MLYMIIAMWMQVTQPLQPSSPLPKLESTVATLRLDPPRRPISYDDATDLYEMRMQSSWKIPSAETVVYVRRRDLVEQFAGDQR